MEDGSDIRHFPVGQITMEEQERLMEIGKGYATGDLSAFSVRGSIQINQMSWLTARAPITQRIDKEDSSR